MSKTILLFPGQGSQVVGMGSNWESLPGNSDILSMASDVMGRDMKALLFEGPEGDLNQTQWTQPALFTVSLMAHNLVQQKGISFEAVAGHSLGEYSALAAAEVLPAEQLLGLVKIRGELMAEAGNKAPGAMSAILGLAPDKIDEVVAGCEGTIVVANYNSNSQIVISGEVASVEAAEKALGDAGAKKVVRLPVSGAFHSPLMDFAVEGLKSAIDALSFSDAKVPVFQNVHGNPAQRGEDIKGDLLRQITSPVRWVKTVENCIAEGYTQGYEVGPGKVLMGLCRGISRDIKVIPCDSLELTPAEA